MSLTIRVGSRPAQYRARATYFDGETARPIDVTVGIDEASQSLHAVADDGTGIDWPLADIRELPDQAGSDILVLRLRDDPVRRIVLPDRGLVPRLPNRTKRAPVTRRGRLLAWAIGALASVALIIFVLVPTLADQLARFIPPEGERALGEATLNQIRDAMGTKTAPVAVCDAPDGVEALGVLQTRLRAPLPDAPELSLHVLDHPMVNAFALPGGNIILFRGLIESASDADEVAAVLAHEIGHIVSRDPTRHALRTAGSIGVLGLVFGDFAGGTVVLFLAERLINASYSQSAELAADSFGGDLLAAAEIRPGALADFLETLQRKFGEAPEFLSHFVSHPRTLDRITAARAAAPEGFQARPALGDARWQALRKICD